MTDRGAVQDGLRHPDKMPSQRFGNGSVCHQRQADVQDNARSGFECSYDLLRELVQ